MLNDALFFEGYQRGLLHGAMIGASFCGVFALLLLYFDRASSLAILAAVFTAATIFGILEYLYHEGRRE